MKTIILPILLFFFTIIIAQNEKITNIGIINFEASVPLFEEVNASNETVQCILNIKTGEINSIALIKNFSFKIPIMEEHFNKYYLESDRYQKAIFKGRIQGFNWDIIGTSPKEFKLKGKLEIHGKKREINTLVLLRKVNDGLEITSDFQIKINDFNIKIPTVLSMKIAENVAVKINYWVN